MIENYKELTVERKNNFYLDSFDYQVLTMLYKPLIGPRAIDLYISMYQLAYLQNPIKKGMMYIKDIISDNYQTDNLLDEFIEHLGKVKLIKLSNGLLELYPPRTGHEFFTCALSNHLKSVTAKTHFEYLKNRFLGEDSEMQIYDVADTSLLALSKKIDYKKRKNDNIPFSFDEFKNNLKDTIDISYLENDREFITSIVNIYNFSLEDMMRIMYEVENDNKYDKDDIIKVAYTKFIKNLEKNERAKSKETKDEDYFKYFKENKAEIILNNKNISSMSKSDESILNQMREKLGLKEEMISLLVCYSISTNNRKLHPIQYFEKIAEDWKNQNISKVEDAYYYINEIYRNVNKAKETQFNKSKKKVEEIDDEWFKNYYNNIKEENNK